MSRTTTSLDALVAQAAGAIFNGQYRTRGWADYYSLMAFVIRETGCSTGEAIVVLDRLSGLFVEIDGREMWLDPAKSVRESLGGGFVAAGESFTSQETAGGKTT